MLVREHGHEVLNVDKLTYAASPRRWRRSRAIRATGCVQADICDRAGDGRRRWPRSRRTRSCIWRPRAMSTARSTGPAPSSRPTSSAPTSCWTRRWPTGAACRPSSARPFRFVHVSTDEVYGSLGAEGRFTESPPYDPNSPYAASKAAADHLARAWHRTYGLPVIVTNCSNNYGPYQFPEKLIPLTIIKALAGEPLPVYGNGENVRDWIHVEDHAARHPRRADPRPGRARATISAAPASARNIEVVRAICAAARRAAPDPAGSRASA